MGELLLGTPRGEAEPSNPAKTSRGRAFLAARSTWGPGLGDRLAARLAGEIRLEQFDRPNSLGCYAGEAPVTLWGATSRSHL